MTHLHLAVASGCPAVVTALAAAAHAHGATLDWAVPGDGGVTPLHLAAMLPGGCALLTGGADACARAATVWLSTHGGNKVTPDMLHAHVRTEASLESPANPEDARSLVASDAESKERGGRPDGAGAATATVVAAATAATGSAADCAHFASLFTPPQQSAGLLHVSRQPGPRRSSDLDAQGTLPLRSPRHANAPLLCDGARHRRCEAPELGARAATLSSIRPCPGLSPPHADAAADCPPYNRPPPLWCRVVFMISAVKVAGFLIEGEGVAALTTALLSLAYGLNILADNTRVFSRLPRVLRGLDACAAGRIFRVMFFIAAFVSGINLVPRHPITSRPKAKLAC
ncbi:hypothetical protein FOA52_008859 [Chlamydomonas sp. UWO 241]|nr:hypothetical protein FOA52_008859 [Chlamydomonas sp. UWO 241]